MIILIKENNSLDLFTNIPYTHYLNSISPSLLGKGLTPAITGFYFLTIRCLKTFTFRIFFTSSLVFRLIFTANRFAQFTVVQCLLILWSIYCLSSSKWLVIYKHNSIFLCVILCVHVNSYISSEYLIIV